MPTLKLQTPVQPVQSSVHLYTGGRAVQNNSGMSDEALLLRRLLGHVTGWFGTKNSALEANQASRPGGLVYKGG